MKSGFIELTIKSVVAQNGATVKMGDRERWFKPTAQTS